MKILIQNLYSNTFRLVEFQNIFNNTFFAIFQYDVGMNADTSVLPSQPPHRQSRYIPIHAQKKRFYDHLRIPFCI